jgi:hypothetical protein
MATQSGELFPVLAAVGGFENRGVFNSRINGVGFAE